MTALYTLASAFGYKDTNHEHLTAVRLFSAKSLLLYSNLSVSEIAFSVEFNDSNHFSNTFKKCVGVSPRDYRKEEHCSNLRLISYMTAQPLKSPLQRLSMMIPMSKCSSRYPTVSRLKHR